MYTSPPYGCTHWIYCPPLPQAAAAPQTVPTLLPFFCPTWPGLCLANAPQAAPQAQAQVGTTQIPTQHEANCRQGGGGPHLTWGPCTTVTVPPTSLAAGCHTWFIDCGIPPQTTPPGCTHTQAPGCQAAPVGNQVITNAIFHCPPTTNQLVFCPPTQVDTGCPAAATPQTLPPTEPRFLCPPTGPGSCSPSIGCHTAAQQPVPAAQPQTGPIFTLTCGPTLLGTWLCNAAALQQAPAAQPQTGMTFTQSCGPTFLCSLLPCNAAAPAVQLTNFPFCPPITLGGVCGPGPVLTNVTFHCPPTLICGGASPQTQYPPPNQPTRMG